MGGKIKILFQLSSLVAVGMVFLISYIVFPERIWNSTTVGALILFAIIVGLMFYSPYLIPAKNDEDDSGQIASIGPVYTVLPLILLTSGAAFLLAILGWEKPVWVLMILTVGGAFIGFSAIYATAEFVGQISKNTSTASARTQWTSLLNSLDTTHLNINVVKKIEDLKEKIQYASSDSKRHADNKINVDISAQIDYLCEKIITGIYNESDLENEISKIYYLVEKREMLAKNSRTKS